MTNKDEIKGKVQEAAGKASDDESQELKGKVSQAIGKAKDKAEEAADTIAGKINKALDKEDQKH